MKGIIQMTILEPLVHLYQKLGRCCRHNNIKIAFFVLLFYFQGLEGTFLPLNFIPLQQQFSPPHSATWKVTYKQSHKRRPSAAERQPIES